jgi:predicted DNA-binding protein
MVNRCYTVPDVTPSAKKQTAFRIEPEILEGLQAIKDRDGVPISEQVRRALAAWLEERGVTKTARPRAATRKRT